ncbi:MAG: DUF3857 and transglutaminase domain-containing protein, partial [Bacteroidota bacterium]
MKKQVLLLALGLLPCCLIAQKKDPIKWGKIDPADLAMTSYDLDSSAAAVVLMDYCRVTFEYSSSDIYAQYDRHKRIKILDRAGFDQADITIPYYSDKNKERIEGMKVQIVAPDGTKEVLKRSEIYDIKVSDNWSEIKFTLPNVQVGSIIEYQYKLKANTIFRLEDWYFQEYIPVRWSELRIEIPDWYEYLAISQGRALDISESERHNRTVTIPGGFGGFNSGNTLFRESRMVMKDVPAMVEEPYVSNIDDYRAQVRFQLNAIQYPQEARKPILEDWEAIAERLRDASYFGRQYLNAGATRKIWKDLEPKLSALSTEQEKAVFLYDFVNQTMKWNEVYNFTTDESLHKCFEKRLGNSAEINLLFAALCRQAGISASPVLISTREHGIHMPMYPIIDQFNHLVILLEFKDGVAILVDLRNSTRPLGMLAVPCLNSAGWLIKDRSQQWIEVATGKYDEKILADLSLDEDGNLKGSMQFSLGGYSGMQHRLGLRSEEGLDWETILSEQFPEVTVTNVTYTNEESYTDPLKVRLDVEVEAAAINAGPLWYLSPFLYSGFLENPFSLEERTYPVDFPYPIKETVVINLSLPEDYRLEELPDEISLSMPNDAGRYSHRVTDNGQKIQLVSRFSIQQTYFDSV